MSDPVGLASIGLGWWGNVLADAVSASGEGRVVSCYARTAETREAFASKHGCQPAGSLDEIWDDPAVEGVLMATPHSVRQELITAAAAAGKHIFLEKPLALTGAEARTAASSAADAGVVLQVGHN
jgi:predicted dehydrogenase